MLRWRSDEALRLYARLNDTAYATWLDEAADSVVDSIRTSNMPQLVERQGFAQQQQWMSQVAVADEKFFDPSQTPQHTLDDEVIELRSHASGLADAAAQYDSLDQ